MRIKDRRTGQVDPVADVEVAAHSHVPDRAAAIVGDIEDTVDELVIVVDGDVPLDTKPLKHTERLLITHYIRYQPHTALQDHNKHFYTIPMLNLKIVKRFVTFDNPCTLCGKLRDNSIHNLAGTELG